MSNIDSNFPDGHDLALQAFVVPEPSSPWLTLSAGSGLLGAMARTRRQRR